MRAKEVATIYDTLPPEEALRILEPLAEAGHSVAQLYVGHLYDEASPRRRSAEALAWYRQAAAAGCVAATHSLASFLYYGFGGEQDLAQALVLLRDCAAAGYIPSQLALGRHLIAVPGAKEEALYWLNLVQQRGAHDSPAVRSLRPAAHALVRPQTPETTAPMRGPSAPNAEQPRRP